MPVEPHQALYRMAARLWREQDRLDDRAHRERFTTALDVWPRRGGVHLRDLQTQWAGMLLAQGFGRDEIAYVLDVKPDTLRRRRIVVLGERAEPGVHEDRRWDEAGGLGGEWVAGVVRRPPPVIRLEGSSRFPRIIPGRYSRSVFEFLEDELGEFPVGDCWVNLPPGLNPPTENGYYQRLSELKRSRAQE